jgi:predicted RNA-binding Zn-ribbon protein involved in translation (DUF1610 family)
MRRSEPQEIVSAVFNTFPAERVLSYAETFSARWEFDDCISVVLHSRRYLTESWGNEYIARVKICRHRNWKYACDMCKKHTIKTMENFMRSEPHRRRDETAV